jgi:hypothetical protein
VALVEGGVEERTVEQPVAEEEEHIVDEKR